MVAEHMKLQQSATEDKVEVRLIKLVQWVHLKWACSSVPVFMSWYQDLKDTCVTIGKGQ